MNLCFVSEISEKIENNQTKYYVKMLIIILIYINSNIYELHHSRKSIP